VLFLYRKLGLTWDLYFYNNIDIDINIDNLSPEIEDILNSPITADEIKSVVQKLKNGKSAGSDNILNE
jgi:hypothetical protein